MFFPSRRFPFSRCGALDKAYLGRAKDLAATAMYKEAAMLWDNVPPLGSQAIQPEFYIDCLLRSGQYANATRAYVSGVVMERCPVCKAKFKDNPVCYRCGMGLSSLLQIERQAELLVQQAVALYGAGHLSKAQQVAKQSLALQRSSLQGWLVEFLAWEMQNSSIRKEINKKIN